MLPYRANQLNYFKLIILNQHYNHPLPLHSNNTILCSSNIQTSRQSLHQSCHSPWWEFAAFQISTPIFRPPRISPSQFPSPAPLKKPTRPSTHLFRRPASTFRKQLPPPRRTRAPPCCPPTVYRPERPAPSLAFGGASRRPLGPRPSGDRPPRPRGRLRGPRHSRNRPVRR